MPDEHVPEITMPITTGPIAPRPIAPGPETTAPRLFVTGDLARGVRIAGTAAQAHYLGTVMRQQPGAPLRLFNGRDGEFGATIEALRRDKLTVLVGPQTRTQTPEPDIWLLFSPLKRDPTDLVVQKATELGIAALLPVFCARTNTARVNTDRFAAIAIEAAEQSERLTIPRIDPPRRLADVLGAWDPARPLAAALEREPGLPPLGAGSAGYVPAGALLIGPEGGFTPGELDVMRATPFIQPVSLGPRILRAETAALAGLALMLSRTW